MTEEKRTGFEMQREFHEAFGHPVKDEFDKLPDAGGSALDKISFSVATRGAGSTLEDLSRDLYKHAEQYDCRRSLRVALILEELAEYLDGEANDDPIKIFDGLVDICVIAEGTALEYGMDLDAGRAEIHRSNMSKLGEDGKPVYKASGKIAKGPNYTPPDLERILFRK